MTCADKKNYYHLDNRRNITAKVPHHFDTQWLFPKSLHNNLLGSAAIARSPSCCAPTVDNTHRIWMKSDPGTSAIYDYETVEYIINSLEGRKYYHFFKYMLLGSEEHYFISLLFNWNRTESFVSTLRAQAIWNTWKYGLWPKNSISNFKTHTHVLTMDLWDVLVGLSRRGVFFARKFESKKTKEILDRIDEELLLNNNSVAGTDWPVASFSSSGL